MFVVQCPHCNDPVWIEQINCGIFRHGIFRHNHEQIPPHAPESECNRLIREEQIYGCGKPFQVILNPSGQVIVQICDYI